MPRVDFVADAELCPACEAELRVEKTRRRTVVTVAAGVFEAREVLKRCVNEDCKCRIGSAALARLLKPRQRYGYDLIVHVGLRRHLAGKQRDEIRTELEDLGIELSAGTVSALCDRFLVALECLHLLRAPYLRAAMQGGYPLHLDATCDRGQGGVFVCMDGWRGWVLMAARIDTERDEHLRPLIDKTVGLFGDPVAVVRDLGEGGAGAVAHLRDRGIPDLVCHYHFLAAVGKNLFDKLYLSLRGLLRSSRLRTDLWALLRELRRYRASESHEGRFGPGQIREELLALVLWVLEGDGHKGVPYPFALPHLDFARRCKQAMSQADRWVARPRSQGEWRAVRHLEGLAHRPERDRRFDRTVLDLDRAWRLFGELRDVLRLSHSEWPGGKARRGQTKSPALELRRLQDIEQAVDAYRKKLQGRVAALTKLEAKSCPDATVLRYLNRYGDRLFGHPVLRAEDSSVLAIVDRTNNVLEHFFGTSKQQLRRRVGRANLGHDLEQQPPQAMLVANLNHPQYVRVLCGSLDNLPAAFAELDAQMLSNATLMRNNRNWALSRRVRALLDADSQALLSANEEPSPRAAPPVAEDDVAEPVPNEQHIDDPCDDELGDRTGPLIAPPPEVPAKRRDLRLPPTGSVLERWHHGRAHRVRVLDDGFEFRGGQHSSLSPVAAVIAGATRSGFDFFGLTMPWEERAASMQGRRINRTTLVDVAPTVS